MRKLKIKELKTTISSPSIHVDLDSGVFAEPDLNHTDSIPPVQSAPTLVGEDVRGDEWIYADAYNGCCSTKARCG